VHSDEIEEQRGFEVEQGHDWGQGAVTASSSDDDKRGREERARVRESRRQGAGSMCLGSDFIGRWRGGRVLGGEGEPMGAINGAGFSVNGEGLKGGEEGEGRPCVVCGEARRRWGPSGAAAVHCARATAGGGRGRVGPTWK
jgi:hypothetical protein